MMKYIPFVIIVSTDNKIRRKLLQAFNKFLHFKVDKINVFRYHLILYTLKSTSFYFNKFSGKINYIRHVNLTHHLFVLSFESML